MGSRVKRILVAPLDWGLGHAARCIPVIRALYEAGHEPILAGSGPHADLIGSEFPRIRSVSLVNYAIRYSRHPFLLALKFPLMVARVFRCAGREHLQTRRIVRELGIDGIISDQRFGCHCPGTPGIYLSHQLCVKMPRSFFLVEAAVAAALRFAANRFTQTWIPDYPGSINLTGDLSRKYSLPHDHRFIGPLSRFMSMDRPHHTNSGPDLLVMLSGPEPQRTLFERMVLDQIMEFSGTAVILRGRPGQREIPGAREGISILNHADSSTLFSLLQSAGAVVCRGGYTTIMELVTLGRKALLVPTPGQTEQEYLCRRLADRGGYVMQRQSVFNLPAGIDALERTAWTPHCFQPPAPIPDLIEQVFNEA